MLATTIYCICIFIKVRNIMIKYLFLIPYCICYMIIKWCKYTFVDWPSTRTFTLGILSNHYMGILFNLRIILGERDHCSFHIGRGSFWKGESFSTSDGGGVSGFFLLPNFFKVVVAICFFDFLCLSDAVIGLFLVMPKTTTNYTWKFREKKHKSKKIISLEKKT